MRQDDQAATRRKVHAALASATSCLSTPLLTHTRTLLRQSDASASSTSSSTSTAAASASSSSSSSSSSLLLLAQ